ncbi:MAG: hypothetical protein J0M33_21870 [Anaerolineae bacterium]|nr:hypothetical protein [Anaerolineae bacterium]
MRSAILWTLFVILCTLGLYLAVLWFIFYGGFKSRIPGFYDIGESNLWNRDNVGYFLNALLPDEIQDFTVQGEMGQLGSYGFLPTLSFSFTASPDVAEAFVSHFCDGVLYAGFDPFNSINSSVPTSNSILVRGNGTIHYASSKNVPASTKGNRCVRRDERVGPHAHWLEEFVLDTGNPDRYMISYNLAYDPDNPVAETRYPRAEVITPLGDRFRLYVTGFSMVGSTYFLRYPTICMETRGSVYIWDNFAMNPDIMKPFTDATMAISIDDLEQPPAIISGRWLSLRPADSDSTDFWQYCLTEDWEPGTHTMKLIVTPPTGESANFEWTFVVPD